MILLSLISFGVSITPSNKSVMAADDIIPFIYNCLVGGIIKSQVKLTKLPKEINFLQKKHDLLLSFLYKSSLMQLNYSFIKNFNSYQIEFFFKELAVININLENKKLELSYELDEIKINLIELKFYIESIENHDDPFAINFHTAVTSLIQDVAEITDFNIIDFQNTYKTDNFDLIKNNFKPVFIVLNNAFNSLYDGIKELKTKGIDKAINFEAWEKIFFSYLIDIPEDIINSPQYYCECRNYHIKQFDSKIKSYKNDLDRITNYKSNLSDLDFNIEQINTSFNEISQETDILKRFDADDFAIDRSIALYPINSGPYKKLVELILEKIFNVFRIFNNIFPMDNFNFIPDESFDVNKNNLNYEIIKALYFFIDSSEGLNAGSQVYKILSKASILNLILNSFVKSLHDLEEDPPTNSEKLFLLKSMYRRDVLINPLLDLYKRYSLLSNVWKNVSRSVMLVSAPALVVEPSGAVVVISALAVGGGYFVYDRNNNKKKILKEFKDSCEEICGDEPRMFFA